ncbi:MAG TPA: hypothetical protein VFW84_00770, partial [Aquabacterium sp.]|uniref:hypothetical protein n=1 Tax=Aquabacterium sp. TaxID=1872578 RepID=UPI002E360C2A
VVWLTLDAPGDTRAMDSGTPPEVTASSPGPMAAEAPVINQAVVAEVMTGQQAAASEIERQPAIQPLSGPITERPAFVSRMEWAMLQGVAQQHAHPTQELTRLVNSLRFTKQLELWQDMSSTTPHAKRQALANELLSDLPQRLINDEMDLEAAKKLQLALLNDAEPDPGRRSVRASKEARRLIVPASSEAASR